MTKRVPETAITASKPTHEFETGRKNERKISEMPAIVVKEGDSKYL